MDKLRERLAALFDTILHEAERNAAFADRLQRALTSAAGAGARGRSSTATEDPGLDKARKGNRRAPAVLDPYAAFESGEESLRGALAGLDVEQLKDVVAEHGMDRSRLALRWKSPGRLIDLIVDTVKTRVSKGSAFRAESTQPSQAPSPESSPRDGGSRPGGGTA